MVSAFASVKISDLQSQFLGRLATAGFRYNPEYGSLGSGDVRGSAGASLALGPEERNLPDNSYSAYTLMI